MNTLKYFIILVFILSFNKGQGQHPNIMTLDEFNAIKINGVRFDAIEKTKGDCNQMKNLFGDGFKVTEGDWEAGRTIEFFNKPKGLYFSFTEVVYDGNFVLDTFDIDGLSNITIRGFTVSVGDPISKLGNVKIIDNHISFSVKGWDSNSLTIDFHPYFKTILSIRYITFY